MSLQIKIFDDLTDANQFLKEIPPESVSDIKLNSDKVAVIYNNQRKFHYRVASDTESSQVIEILANHANAAWEEIDEIAGASTLEYSIVLLCNQTLKRHWQNSSQLFGHKTSLETLSLTDTIRQPILDMTANSDGFRIYQLLLNENRYNKTKYGYILARYNRHDPDYQSPVTHISFLDNQYQPHGTDFALDASQAPQWKLL